LKQIIDIPMGTNCAPLLADIVYSYKAEFIQNNDKKYRSLKSYLQVY